MGILDSSESTTGKRKRFRPHKARKGLSINVLDQDHNPSRSSQVRMNAEISESVRATILG